MKELLIGAAALAVVTPAIAQVAAQAPAPARTAKVHTRAEVQTKVSQHFGRLDSNRDGFVTRAEADAARAQFADRRKERRENRREQAFERIDTNHDGAISRAEWDARSAQRAQRLAERGHDGRGHRGMRWMHGFGGRMFERADANRDGRVSLQEAQTAALQRFDMVDANRDGQITREERIQMHQRMRAERQRG